ncbi:MAG: hypothetical protein H0V24_09800 [Chloroflexia bacterium]|nr:hypothetical protein [Chloroflexia bacterium]
MSLLRITIVGAVAFLITVSPAAAQPATPLPSVEICAVDRREVSAIVAILGRPVATPPATPALEHGDQDHGDHIHSAPPRAPEEPIGTPRLLRPEFPAGDPVAAETSNALTETMQRYLACANGSDVIGLMSLVSDEFLRDSFGAGSVTGADLRAYAANAETVPVERRRRLVAIREPRRLPAGQVVALIDTAPVASANPNAIDTDLVTFILVNEQYLIDRYVAGVTVWFGPRATPAP